MNLDKIDSLIKSNERELKEIEAKNGEYASFSEKALDERKKFLKDENDKLNIFVSKYKALTEEVQTLEERKNDEKDRKKVKEISQKIKDKKNELKDIQRSVKALSQGRTRDVVSSLVGQVDKRITNLVYKNNRLWGLHTNMVEKRYDSPIRYFLKNGAIILGTLSVASLAVTAIPALAPVMTVVGIADGVFLTNTVVKSVSAIYNNYKYGGHIPFERQRERDIQKGSFIENVKNSLFKKRKSSLSRELDNTKEKIVTSEKKEDFSKEEIEEKNPYEKAVSSLKTIDFDKISYEDLLNVYWSAKRFEDKLPVDVLENYNRIKNLIDEKTKATDDVKKEEEIKAEEIKKEEETFAPITVSDDSKEDEEKVTDEVRKPIVGDVKREYMSSKVRSFVSKVERLNPNNLDKNIVESYFDEFLSMTYDEKKQVPNKVLNTLLLALKMVKSEIAKTNQADIKYSNVYESELNKLVERVDIDKIQKVLNERKKAVSGLSQQDKVALHDELVDIRNILRIISSEKVSNTSLDGKNIAKLNKIIGIFGDTTQKVDKAVPNRVEIELFDVTDKSGRHLVGFSGECVFYFDDKKLFKRMVSFDNDSEEYIENKIRSEIYGFDGEIVIRKNSESLGSKLSGKR